jgi:hypothetical protein
MRANSNRPFARTKWSVLIVHEWLLSPTTDYQLISPHYFSRTARTVLVRRNTTLLMVMHDMEMCMKLLATALALATLVASPAFAQSYDPDLGSGNIVPRAGLTAPWLAYHGHHGAYARVPGGTVFQSPYDVYDAQGNVVGADPDPNIRAQLRRGADRGRW